LSVGAYIRTPAGNTLCYGYIRYLSQRQG